MLSVLAIGALCLAIAACGLAYWQNRRLTDSLRDQEKLERSSRVIEEERRVLEMIAKGYSLREVLNALTAAISGDSLVLVQGTAGTTEDHIKYSWNIARVIAEGPTPQNLIPSPTMIAMKGGKLLRFEERLEGPKSAHGL